MADCKKEATAGIEDKVISLRPHHVQRLFYDWQGEDFMGQLALVREGNGIKRYDENTLHQIKAIYDGLFFHNTPFVITPGVDDICRECNVLKKIRPDCIGLDDIALNRDFQNIFGIDFERSYEMRFYGTTTQLKYEPTIRYAPIDVVVLGIQGLKQVISNERAYPKQFSRRHFIGGIADKIAALEAAYEYLRRLHGRD